MGDGARVESRPSGTVTFLFTDVEGSTRRWEVHGAAMASCISRHDAILRAAIDERRGRVVKSMGDGVMAVFANADDALRAALAGQAAIEAEDWSPVPRLRVRMGLHTGWCTPTGDDYFGAIVNRAARIADTGHGGQILISSATHAVLQDVDDLEIISRGKVRLKDLGEPIELHQVLGIGLNNELLALRTLDADLGSLPLQRTTFIGRRAELEHAVRTLEGHRLLTLTGPGGVGKTRLAVQLAAEVAQQFEAGVCFIDLAEIDASGHVATTVLDQLHRKKPEVNHGTAIAAPLEGVIRYLSGVELLVIMDNCEHVVRDAGAVVDEILRHCPQVRVVATSREPLDVHGEQVVAVTGLSGEGDVDGSAAVQLFIERAVSRGATPPTGDALPVVARICELVDGLPLGIELAAARSVHIKLEALAARLAEHHGILQGRDATRPDRHRSVEELVRWSFDLLRPDERDLLIRLAVFTGPVTLDAIEALCGDGDLPRDSILDRLGGLVDRSLVVYDDAAGTYRLLNIVRAFARSQLDDTGTRRWRRRHAEWCTASLRAATSSENDEAVARFMNDHGPDVAAAMSWTIADSDADQACALAGLSWRWYEMTGRVREGLEIVQGALRTGSPADTRNWAIAVTGAANLALVLGDVEYARQMHQDAIDAFERCGAVSDAAWARIGLAIAWSLAGDAAAAVGAAEASDGTFRRLDDLQGVGHASAALGVIAARAGDHDAAKRHYLEALAKFRLAGHRRDTASVLSNLGNLSQDRAEHREASRFYDGALQLYREIGDRRGAGLILNNICLVAQALGHHDRAVELALEAIDEFNRVHDRQGAAAARHNLANLAVETGDPDRALAYYREAVEGFRQARDPRGVIVVLDAAAEVAWRYGRAATGWRLLLDRARVTHHLGVRGLTQRSLVDLAARADEAGLDDLARRLRDASVTLLSDDVLRALEAAAHVEIGDDTRASAGTGPRPLGGDPFAALTSRELELLVEVGRGKSNSEIADALFISRRTVDAHLSHIRTKLGVTDRSKLIVLARDHLAEATA